MGRLVFVLGRSGRGKSTSLRTLNPEETLIINADQNGLPFKQFALNYNEQKGNYIETSNINTVVSKLKEAHNNSKIKVIVIDTLSRIMTDYVQDEKFRKSKGFDKWDELASDVYNIINIINDKLRNDIVVYVLAHTEVRSGESGFPEEKLVVQGKKLERYTLESFSKVVLYAEIIKNHGQKNSYMFRTVSSGEDSCKSPIDMFDKDYINNNLAEVDKSIREYYGI